MDCDLETQREAYARIEHRIRWWVDLFKPGLIFALIYGTVAMIGHLLAAYLRWAGVQ